jgi:hypothetical protein
MFSPRTTSSTLSRTFARNVSLRLDINMFSFAEAGYVIGYVNAVDGSRSAA